MGKSPFPSAAVPLKRRFRVLEERKGEKSSTEGEESGLSISGFSIRTNTIKQETMSFLVVEFFFLHGTKPANFHNSVSFQEVFCFPGAQI